MFLAGLPEASQIGGNNESKSLYEFTMGARTGLSITGSYESTKLPKIPQPLLLKSPDLSLTTFMPLHGVPPAGKLNSFPPRQLITRFPRS